MLTTAQAANALHSVVGLAVLWLLVCVGWKSYHVDSLRQELFDIRDRLFDIPLKYDRKLFRHPSYVLLRYRINAVIRLAHMFTTTRLLWSMIVCRKYQPPPEEWTKNLSDLPKEVQDSLRRVHRVMLYALVARVFHIPFPVLAYLLKSARVATEATGGGPTVEEAKSTIVAKVEMLEAQAVEERELAVAR